ncbi:MAG: GNAT family N-acetyltransferase [Armatimonadota bacterium]
MDYQLRSGYDPQWLDALLHLYEVANLGKRDPERLHQAFTNSFRVFTCWNGGTLCGAGRMLSDGATHSAIFDIAVLPEYQRRGIGRKIMEALQTEAPDTRFVLTSSFSAVQFYRSLGFRKHKTGMVKYPSWNADSPYLEEEA